MENVDAESKPRKSTLRLSSSKPYFTESIFIQQKKKIQELLDINKTRTKIRAPFDSTESSKVILFNDINLEENTNWEYSTYDVQYIYNEYTPIIKADWSESNIKSSSKGVEIRGLIFRSKDFIKMDNSNYEISTTFSLKGESSLWIICRSDIEFNEFSSIIRISKDDKSQNVHISMGTFVKDTNQNLVFKIFSKQQLIDYSKIRNKSYKENDIVEIRVHLLETGEDKIVSKIYLNDSKTENLVVSEFFLPYYEKKSRIMLAGSGQQCCVKSFICKSHLKVVFENGEERNSSIFTNEKRNCDCCSIF